LLNKLVGFNNLTYNVGIPIFVSEVKHHVSKCWAKWKMKGVDQNIECEIALVSHGSTTSIDALSGKAERKLKYRIHCIATGSQILESEERDESEYQSQPATKSITAHNMESGE